MRHAINAPLPSVTVGFFPRERFAMAGESLRSILRNAGMPFTLVIVDCPTPDRYRREMEEAVAGHANVRWIRLDRLPIVNESRNLIANATNDEYVCFIENAATAHPGWLERLVRSCRETGVGAAIPLVYEGPRADGKVHHDRGFAKLVRDEDGSGRIRTLHDDGTIDHAARMDRPTVFTTLESHCIMLARGTLDAIGPFDERLTVNTHVDIAYALFTHGIKMIFEPRSIIEHHPVRYLQPDERALYAFRWDPKRADESMVMLRKKWPLNRIPDAADFARGQFYRVHPLLWNAYRAARIPRWIRQRFFTAHPTS